MNTQQLRNSILQQAIQGKLVPQDPNDEPASVLLERIRQQKEQLVKEGKLKPKDLVTTPVTEEEMPFDIPQSWKWIHLGEIFAHNNGKQLNRADNQGEYHKYITTSNVYWDRFDLKEVRQMLFTEEELKKCTATKGDLLVCEGGDVGRSAIWNFDYDICIQNHIHRVRAYYPLCTRYFLYILMLNKSIGLIGGKGIGIQGFSATALHNTLIALPPLAEQKRIVAKLEELLPLVEQYGKAQDNLDALNTDLPRRLRQSILQEAIQGKLVPQDPNDEPASVLLDRIRQQKEQLVKEGKLKKKDLVTTPVAEEEIPFDIPESWEWCKFGDIVSTMMGKTPPRNDSNFWQNGVHNWVAISDMKDYGHIHNTKELVSEYAAAHAFREKSKAGDLLMSFKLTVGRTSILEIPAYHNEAIITINPYVDEDFAFRNFLFYLLPLIANMGESKDAIKGRTLNSTSIYNLPIPLPPLAEQKRIVAKIEQLLSAIDNLK